jgi:hypothetical protein
MVMKLRGKDYRKDSRFNSEWEESVYDLEIVKRDKQRKNAKTEHQAWLARMGLDRDGIAERREKNKWTR